MAGQKRSSRMTAIRNQPTEGVTEEQALSEGERHPPD